MIDYRVTFRSPHCPTPVKVVCEWPRRNVFDSEKSDQSRDCTKCSVGGVSGKLAGGNTDPSRFFCFDPIFSICSSDTVSDVADENLYPWGFGRIFSGPCGCSLLEHARYNQCCSTFDPSSIACRQKSACHTSHTKQPVQKPGSIPIANWTGRNKLRCATLTTLVWNGESQSR